MSYKTDAICRGGNVYTIINLRDERPWRYLGLKNGQRWRAFKSKREWAQAVEMEPDEILPFTEKIKDALEAEWLSTWKGEELLKDLKRALARQRSAARSEASQ